MEKALNKGREVVEQQQTNNMKPSWSKHFDPINDNKVYFLCGNHNPCAIYDLSLDYLECVTMLLLKTQNLRYDCVWLRKLFLIAVFSFSVINRSKWVSTETVSTKTPAITCWKKNKHTHAHRISVFILLSFELESVDRHQLVLFYW